MQPFESPQEDLRQREACHIKSMGHPVEFSSAARAELEELFTRYPTKDAVVLPALWIAQREFGWISTEVIDLVAELCDQHPSHVYGVVSFYTMYNRLPRGKYHIQICANLSCQLRDAENILDYLKKKLKIELGETTPDGLFSLSTVECLGACEMAPMMQVNDAYHGPLTEASLDELLERFRKEAIGTGSFDGGKK